MVTTKKLLKIIPLKKLKKDQSREKLPLASNSQLPRNWRKHPDRSAATSHL